MSNHRANDGSNEAQYNFIKKQKYVFKTVSKTRYNEVKVAAPENW